MNLIEAGLRDDDGYAVHLDGRAVRRDGAESAERGTLDDYVGNPVLVGIRPERLEDAMVARDIPPERGIGGLVTLREMLGSDVLVHFEVEDGRPLSGEARAAVVSAAADPVELEPATEEPGITFIGRFDPSSQIGHRERVEAAIRPGAIQLFDARTGAAIGR